MSSEVSTPTSFKPTVYVKTGCPFSFRFLVFIMEAGLYERFTIIEVNPEWESDKAIREHLEQATGKKPAFPTVEVAKGDYRSDSEALIDYYAQQEGVDTAALAVLDLYNRGLFDTYLRMVKKIKANFPDFFNH